MEVLLPSLALLIGQSKDEIKSWINTFRQELRILTPTEEPVLFATQVEVTAKNLLSVVISWQYPMLMASYPAGM